MEPKKNTKEFGDWQKRRIIDALRREPMTEWQLADLLGVVRNTVTMHMTQLRKEGRVYRASYIRSVTGRPLPVYGAGKHPDAIYTPKKVVKPKQPCRVTAVKTAMLILLQKPHTTVQLSAKLNRSASVIRFYILQLRREKQIRIAQWKQTGDRNGWAPCYKIGFTEDRPRPPKMTSSEYHARQRANPENRERDNRQRQIRYNISKLRAKPATIFSALGL